MALARAHNRDTVPLTFILTDVADDSDTLRLRELLESTGPVQYDAVPSHIGEHTLDLIITRQSDQLGISCRHQRKGAIGQA